MLTIRGYSVLKPIEPLVDQLYFRKPSLCIIETESNGVVKTLLSRFWHVFQQVYGHASPAREIPTSVTLTAHTSICEDQIVCFMSKLHRVKRIRQHPCKPACADIEQNQTNVNVIISIPFRFQYILALLQGVYDIIL